MGINNVKLAKFLFRRFMRIESIVMAIESSVFTNVLYKYYEVYHRIDAEYRLLD